MVNKIIAFSLSFLIQISLKSQLIEVDSILSENQFSSYQNQKLILIDFWATWCSPCIPATKQLEIFQELYARDIYMVSISDESNQKVSAFLKEKPIRLAVVTDYKKTNFKKYKVEGRPYAVILNANAEKVWEGKPGDLTTNILDKLIMKQQGNLSKKINATPFKKSGNGDFSMNGDTSNVFIIERGKEKSYGVYYNFSGTLKSFVSEYKSIPLVLLADDEVSLSRVNLLFPKAWESMGKYDIADSVLSILNIEMSASGVELMATKLEVVNKKLLWDSMQIIWESGSPNYMVGDSRLEADNVTLKEIASILSNAKNELFIYEGLDTNIYDWSFLYTIDPLMTEELENTFGIKLKKELCKLKRYQFGAFEYKSKGIDIQE